MTITLAYLPSGSTRTCDYANCPRLAEVVVSADGASILDDLVVCFEDEDLAVAHLSDCGL